MITVLAFFQCVQCARTAEAMGLARLAVLWQGVWILLLPPLAVFGGILYVSCKRSRQADVGMARALDSRMGARR